MHWVFFGTWPALFTVALELNVTLLGQWLQETGLAQLAPSGDPVALSLCSVRQVQKSFPA